jgi:germination protein M
MPAMATCGTGCRGTFDVTLPYSVPAAGWGTLRVWEASAMDGSPQNVREYPVWLTSAE